MAIDPEQQAYVATAEDMILAKLEWYDLGNRVSDQQWRDLLAMIKVQGPLLDQAYLHRWASALGIADLLARADGCGAHLTTTRGHLPQHEYTPVYSVTDQERVPSCGAASRPGQRPTAIS